MRFFIDAQLPHALVNIFSDLGHETLHARDLPKGNDTKDEEILSILDFDIVIVSKDSDFYKNALIHGKPAKLVYVTVPNQPRRVIIDLFQRSAPRIINLLSQHDVLQLEMNAIIGVI